MNALVACLVLVAMGVGHGVPVPPAMEPPAPSYPMKLTDTARTLQSIAHMAVVDVMAPIHTALWTLETKWFDLLEVASEKQVHIPSFDKPKVDLEDIFYCKAKSNPKYSAALKFLMDNEKAIEYHVKNATTIAKGLHFVSQLIVDDKINEDILMAATTKLAKYLVDYSKILQGVKSAVCVEIKMVMEESKPQNDVESPLAVFGYNYVESKVDEKTFPERDTDSEFLIGRGDTDSAHLIGRGDTDSAHLIGRGDSDSAHLIGRGDSDSAHLIGRGDTDSAHLIGRGDTDSADLIGRGDSDSAHLIGRGDSDSAHLIGRGDTDSAAQLIGKRMS